MSKLLILGASSSVGSHLYSRLGPERAIGTFNSKPVPGGRRFDSLSMRLNQVVEKGEARHAAVLLADPQPDSCLKDPEKSRRLNVTAMMALLEQCWELGIVPIFASTEFVFDGAKGDYIESDRADPILLYGQQKKEIEDFLAASGRPYCCFRLAKVYGDRPGDGTLFTAWASQLAGGTRHFRCAVDQRFSPVFVGDVGETILRMADRDLRGVYHLSGNQAFSRIDLLRRTVAAFAARRPVEVEIEACSIDDFPLPEPRPKDVSMRADALARATGFRFADVDAQIAQIVDAVIAAL